MASILVIDDERYIREMLQRHLESRGHEVSTAPDGITGMEIFRNRPADVVIVDILMPRELGTTTMLHLRSEFPDTRIIAISGGGDLPTEHGLEIARQVGADRTFPKPLDIRGLLQAVDDLSNTIQRWVKAVLDEYLNAIRTGDFDKVRRCTSQEDDVVFIDPVSKTVAKSVDTFRRSVTMENRFVVRPVDYSLVCLKSIGPITMFAAECVIRILGEDDHATRSLPGLWTGAVENRDGSFLVVQSHMSVSYSTARKAEAP